MKSYKLIISGPDPTLNYSVSYSDFVSQNKIIEYIQYLTIPFYIYIMLYREILFFFILYIHATRSFKPFVF